MKKHNFSAGPSILADEVISKASKSVIELNNIGLSLIEISHRSPDFVAIMEKARELSLELLNLDKEKYTALFLQGGASLQFLMSAYNLLETKAAYINTGSWSDKAIKEAKLLGEVHEIASSKSKNYNHIPKNILIENDYDYLHITTNNTIYGTQFHEIPNTNIPLVADMSSDIFSRNVDFSKFDLFYAGAQKNLGPSGVTLVVVKKEILGKVSRNIPSMLNYLIHIDKDSMFNTPPVFPTYVCLLTLEWLKNNGGLDAIEKLNNYKAKLIYDEIDRNKAFVGFAEIEDRSLMNATFNLVNGVDGKKFNELCLKNNISGIKGHRSVGGYRASIYNALPIESVEILIDTMKKFENLI
jgi:phosphoserine aminotransferase|tara:strand:- start:811 stop:1875 length:1065 start_codon:yes stop_codon:yes gene_type:complete